MRIPAELAYANTDMDLKVERVSDVLRIRPVARRMGDVLGALSGFSPDFMAQEREANTDSEREPW